MGYLGVNWWKTFPLCTDQDAVRREIFEPFRFGKRFACENVPRRTLCRISSLFHVEHRDAFQIHLCPCSTWNNWKISAFTLSDVLRGTLNLVITSPTQKAGKCLPASLFLLLSINPFAPTPECLSRFLARDVPRPIRSQLLQPSRIPPDPPWSSSIPSVLLCEPS